MSNTQERIKQRREYVDKKSSAYTLMALGTIGFVAWNVYLIYILRQILAHKTPFGAISWAVVILGSSIIFIGYILRLRQDYKEVAQLPYVPPVTPDSLSAEEILVRGAEEPKQDQPQVLLRGTGEPGATALSNTQERIKQRRQYLMNKGKGYIKATKEAIIAIGFILYALLMLFLTRQNHNKPSDIMYPLLKSKITVFSMWVMFGIVMPVLVYQKVCSMYRCFREAKQLRYVPPVTSDTLLAEEVLVRASEQPIQEQKQVLLRGTGSCTVTSEQELLRISQPE